MDFHKDSLKSGPVVCVVPPLLQKKRKKKKKEQQGLYFVCNMSCMLPLPHFQNSIYKKKKHSEQLQASQIQSQTCMWPRYAGVTRGLVSVHVVHAFALHLCQASSQMSG